MLRLAQLKRYTKTKIQRNREKTTGTLRLRQKTTATAASSSSTSLSSLLPVRRATSLRAFWLCGRRQRRRRNGKCERSWEKGRETDSQRVREGNETGFGFGAAEEHTGTQRLANYPDVKLPLRLRLLLCSASALLLLCFVFALRLLTRFQRRQAATNCMCAAVVTAPSEPAKRKVHAYTYTCVYVICMPKTLTLQVFVCVYGATRTRNSLLRSMLKRNVLEYVYMGVIQTHMHTQYAKRNTVILCWWRHCCPRHNWSRTNMLHTQNGSVLWRVLVALCLFLTKLDFSLRSAAWKRFPIGTWT